MLVVLASRYDRASARLVADWAGDARLLTCEDLSVSGWRQWTAGGLATSVIGGKPTEDRDIDGVLTRLPTVPEGELTSIVAGDRGYVAAEMTAFLSAWLSELPCPVLNRPTPVCLTGPNWRRERWVLAAGRVGIPVAEARRSVPAGPDDRLQDLLAGSVTVTVVGRRCLGEADELLSSAALALAEAARVGLLRARFASREAGSVFLDADFWADLTDPTVSDAILAYFAEGSRQ